jgi:hypothetical protein
MPAARLNGVAGPTEVGVDRRGGLSAVRHRASPAVLDRLGPAEVVPDAVPDGPQQADRPPRLTMDADEVEVVDRVGPVEVVTRHSFDPAWTTRLVLRNRRPEPVRVQRWRLPWLPAADVRAWTLALGTDALVLLIPTAGTTPLLLARVTGGTVTEADQSGLAFGPVELGPDGRQVVSLSWSWVPDPRELLRRLPGELPRTTTVPVGDHIPLTGDPDTAAVIDPEVDLLDAGRQPAATANEPGRHRLELRSARGTTVVELCWAPPVADLLAGTAARALGGPRTPAGVPKLTGLAAAMVVQHSLVDGRLADPEEAAEALDLFTARRPAATGLPPLWACYLLGEHQRLGEEDLLEDAVTVVTSQHGVAAGLGSAVVRSCVALLLAGRPPGPVLAAAEARLGTAAGSSAAVTELRLATVRVAGGRWSAELGTDVDLLGRQLGAGLPGRAVLPLPPVDQAQLAAVLRLVPEELGIGLARRWGSPAAAIADRAGLELAARLVAAQPGGEGAAGPAGVEDCYAWLVLAEQAR